MALEIFLVKFEILYFQLMEESTKTPKYLMDSFSFIAFLLILIVTCCFNGLWMKYYKISFIDVK